MEVEHVEIVEQEEEVTQTPASQPVPEILRPYKNPNLKLVKHAGSSDLKRTSPIVHPELIIEKHADTIFSLAHAKDLNQPRSITWAETQNNTQLYHALTVGPYDGKRPTVKTRKTYLALQHITEERGWNDNEETICSHREIAKTLALSWSGYGKRKQDGKTKGTIKELHDELFRARFAPFILKVSGKDKEGNLISYTDTFTLLDTLKILEVKDRKKEERFERINLFRFHKWVRNRIKDNKTRPTHFETVRAIKGEIASLLYARLDIILADNDHYERTTKGVFEDLRIESERYKYPSNRKTELKKAIKELQGKPISNGILHLALEKTKDGRDWKLVARKTPFKKKTRHVQSRPQALPALGPEQTITPEETNRLIKEIEDALGAHESEHRFFFRAALATYPYHGVIDRVLSEWKADGGNEKEDRLKYFKAILHRTAHFEGYPWVEGCPDICKYRPND